MNNKHKTTSKCYANRKKIGLVLSIFFVVALCVALCVSLCACDKGESEPNKFLISVSVVGDGTAWIENIGGENKGTSYNACEGDSVKVKLSAAQGCTLKVLTVDGKAKSATEIASALESGIEFDTVLRAHAVEARFELNDLQSVSVTSSSASGVVYGSGTVSLTAGATHAIAAADYTYRYAWQKWNEIKNNWETTACTDKTLVLKTASESGSYRAKITFSKNGKDGDEYKTCTFSESKTVSITKKPLTAVSDSFPYDGVSSSFLVNVTNENGLVGEDSLAVYVTMSSKYCSASVFKFELTGADAENYSLAQSELSYHITKGTPIVSTKPTASGIFVGQSLANSTLGGGTASVEGGFDWVSATETPTVSADKQVRFTPTDTVNYETVDIMVSVAVTQLRVKVLGYENGFTNPTAVLDGTEYFVNFNYGETKTIYIYPIDDAYVVTNVILDGVEFGVVPTVTISNLTANGRTLEIVTAPAGAPEG